MNELGSRLYYVTEGGRECTVSPLLTLKPALMGANWLRKQAEWVEWGNRGAGTIGIELGSLPGASLQCHLQSH